MPNVETVTNVVFTLSSGNKEEEYFREENKFAELLNEGLERTLISDCLQKTQKDAISAKSELDQLISERNVEFENVRKTSLGIKSRVESFLKKVEEVQEKVNKQELEVEDNLAVTLQEELELAKEVEFNKQYICALQQLIPVEDSLTNFEKAVEMKDFSLASELLKKLEKLLASDQLRKDTTIFKLVSEKHVDMQRNMIVQLEDLFSEAISFVRVEGGHDIQTRSTLIVTSQNGQKLNISLGEVIDIMRTLGILDKSVNVFKRSFLKHILRPFSKHPDSLINVEKTFDSARLTYREMDNEANEGQYFDNLTEVFDFVALHVCNVKEDSESQNVTINSNNPLYMVKNIGKLLPEICQEIISGYLSPALPSRLSELDSFAKIGDKAKKFEERLHTLGFVEREFALLTKYVDDIDIHFSERLRENLLETARTLMIAEDFSTVEIADSPDSFNLEESELPEAIQSALSKNSFISQVEELHLDDMFLFPACSITKPTQSIVNLAYQSLEEAKELNEFCASSLYESVRDMFDLYKAIMPAHYQHIYENVPALGMLFHNDCMYIMHHLQTLGYQFSKLVKNSTNPSYITFVDMVPEFRNLGEKYFNIQLRSQRNSLIDTISSLGGFHDATLESKYHQIESTLNQIVYSLNQLSKIWKPVLPSHLALKAIGLLLDTVVARCIQEIQDLGDISEEESHHLYKLSTILTACDQLVAYDGINVQDALATYVPHWSKYHKQIELLELSFAEIMERFRTGQLDEFKPNELENLIRAIFADTALRTKNLEEIGRTYRYQT
ncbi:ribosome biogenesis protein ytm1 [Basidiobolus ranarum]|uniref:Ribosome biogenesis protein ytm1 n=1 Tax=Basidiobolus ranarum TaxID=34480 RepID=A0ABR2W1Z8_9FUNG